MPLSLALAAPPPMYDVTPPATYAQARGTLTDAGTVMRQVIAEQPPQTSIAQVLTAQVLKEFGGGWSILMSTVASDPKNPESGNSRMLWEPGNVLVLAFSEVSASTAVCTGLEGLYRAAAWWNVLQNATGSESIEQIESRFSSRLVEMASHSSYGTIEDQIGEAGVAMFQSLFQFSGNRSPLFEELSIRWGTATSCITELGQRYRDD